MSVAVGFRAKTGRAIAVILAAPARFIWRGEVSLLDASMSRDTGPYHLVMELPWSESEIAVQKYVKPIQAVATRMLASLMKQYAIGAVAVVGSPDRNLAKIGNEHIRAHAAEGVLFRAVVETAAKLNDCPSRAFADPAAELRQPSRQVKKVLEQFGKAAGPPWRADEKAAAIAAWVALAIPSRPSKR